MDEMTKEQLFQMRVFRYRRRGFYLEGLCMITESEIDAFRARIDEYNNRRRAFMRRAFIATHKPAKCAWCGEYISPGTCVLVAYHGLDLVVFCSRDCYADAHGARLLCFGDSGYDSLFDEKESINDEIH